MNELKIFENPAFGKIRVTVNETGEPLFVAADVCQALEISNHKDAIKRLDEDERLGVVLTDPHGRPQETNCITESGLYALVLGSRKKEAKAFKRWVTHEVLPAIRKTGGYVNNEDLFLDTYLPGVDEGVRTLFKLTLGQLRSANERVKELETDLHLLALQSSFQEKKVAYFDACVERNTLTTIRETAKLCGVGEKRFVRYLLDNRYLYRGRGGKLLPYATRPAEEMFVVKEFFDPERRHGGVQTYVTPRGRETFRLLLNGQPESGLWGRPSKELPPEMEMTPRAEEALERFYRKRDRQRKHA